MRRINVDGIKVASCSVRKAIDFVRENRESLNGKYITFVNMYSLVCAREDHCYKKAQQGAAVSFADGFPVVAYQKLHGGRFAKRVPGPEFMKRLLEISSKRGGKESHFFLGSDYETLSKLTDNLRYRFPSINIAGIYDPWHFIFLYASCFLSF